MPRSRLTAQIERIREQDSFYASKQGKQANEHKSFGKNTKSLDYNLEDIFFESFYSSSQNLF